MVNFDEINYFTDMWSVGVICYVLLSGLSPFQGETDIDTMTNVTLGKYNFEDDAFNLVSDTAKDFIRKLLQKDPRFVCRPRRHQLKVMDFNENRFIFSKRLSGQDSLKHPWLITSALNTELSVTKAKLKRYVVKKRWIKAVNTIIALHRMGARLDVSLV